MFLKDVVLILNDKITGTVLDCALSLEGYRVEQVTEVARAKERLIAGGFDIAIIDIAMAGIEGYDLCREVKRARRGFQCLIVLSGGTLSGDFAELLEADYVLSKPFRINMLLNIMNELSEVSELDCIYR